jgi:hypothetical protein
MREREGVVRDRCRERGRSRERKSERDNNGKL